MQSRTCSGIRDANNRPIRIVGAVDMLVTLGREVARTRILVCDRLPAPVFLGRHSLNRHAQSIFAPGRRIQLNDYSFECIIRKRKL